MFYTEQRFDIAFGAMCFAFTRADVLGSALTMLPVPQANTGELDPLYVVEVLLHCSKESVKNAATEAARPCKPGDKGEMQVCRLCLARPPAPPGESSSE